MELAYYDTTILALGALILGVVMLIKGGGWAVDSGVFIASRFGISPMIVGFTIIAFGTSLPELIVSVFANLQGSAGIALGNVLGSNIANILLVLGCTAIFTTLKVKLSKMLIRDLLFMMAVTILLTALLINGDITRFIGGVMVAILAAYILFQYKTIDKNSFVAEETNEAVFKNAYIAYLTLFAGLLCIAIGAEFLVKGAKVSASLIGVPESVIALSIIAFGTSLPELSTSIIAARKGQVGMVIGNIIGSNVFNILMIIGITALVKPIMQGSFAPQIINFDVWVTLLVGLFFVLILFIFKRINRVIGSLFLLSYIIYNIYIYMINVV